jgi:phosphatidylglycerol:prolipoprotein diacylglycerol transferase
MFPILLSSPRVPSYGAILVLACGLGWWLARRRARGLGIPVWHIDWLVPLLLAGAGVGARLTSLGSQWVADDSGNDRLLYGGLLTAVGVAVVYAKVACLPLGRLGDAFAFALPVGICLLRVGCFLGGCCWGDICGSPDRLSVVEDQAWRRQVQTFPPLCDGDWPLAVTFPAGSPAYYQHLTAGLLPPGAERSLPVHPVQLYETAACLGLLGLLCMLDARLRRWGESFLACGVGYSAIRFVVEWFRADTRPLVWGLTLAQLASIFCAGMCLIAWRMRRRLAQAGHADLHRAVPQQEGGQSSN